MENIKIPVLFTTFYVVIYAMLPGMGMGFSIMFILFLISQFLVIWMVIRVLKDGKPSGKQFNKGHWYDDWDYKAIAD